MRWFKNYAILERALRDYTCSTLPGDAEGDEIVQTFNHTPILKSSVKSNKKTRKTKIDWPTDKELLELVQSYPMTKVGKILGVSDTAVRKHLKRRGLSLGN